MKGKGLPQGMWGFIRCEFRNVVIMKNPRGLLLWVDDVHKSSLVIWLKGEVRLGSFSSSKVNTRMTSLRLYMGSDVPGTNSYPKSRFKNATFDRKGEPLTHSNPSRKFQGYGVKGVFCPSWYHIHRPLAILLNYSICSFHRFYRRQYIIRKIFTMDNTNYNKRKKRTFIKIQRKSR